jgi:eukaryotic-like serine/threonine-protein kinase
MIGETILHYKILEKLGEGGMGEVFKAQDTKLDRFVALKFLPSQLTASEDDKARFIQEAKAASAMNHPNICTIYSIEEYNNQLFISMEYVEGKTLKTSVETHRDASLPTKQILEIGIQVAEGLAAAHEKGIVHRDIKPENIMVRKDGIVQIMDFGLAKLYRDSNASRLTKAGSTVGTMGYMSPEQVQGLDVDHRTDIFSLGVVLYELLAGESPFKGMHETAIMYEIVNVDAPPISTVKEGIDPELDEIILECLEKDKDERYQSAKELSKDLRKVKKSSGHRKSRVYKTQSFEQTNEKTNTKSGVFDVNFKKKLFKNKIPLAVISVLTVALLITLYALLNSSQTVSTRPMHLSLNISDGISLGPWSSFAISQDGLSIVYVVDRASSRMLYVRKFDSFTGELIPGTEGAYSPFFSPDGKWIGFIANGEIKKVFVSGGAVINIYDIAPSIPYVFWGQDNNIYITPENAGGIYKVSSEGGKQQSVVDPNDKNGGLSYRFPVLLPDNNLIFTSVSGSGSNILGKDFKTGDVKTIVDNATYAQYLKSGYLTYIKDNTLFVVKFDEDNLALSGTSLPMITGVTTIQQNGLAEMSISANGTLVYLPGGELSIERNLIWVDQFGKITKSTDLKQTIEDMNLSPDGKKIAVTVEGTIYSIWIYDIERGNISRLTYNADDRDPFWLPDGKSIVYGSFRNGYYGMYLLSTDRNQQEIRLTKTKNWQDPYSVSSDGKYLFFAEEDSLGQVHNAVMELKEGAKPDFFAGKKFFAQAPSISPNNKYIAYESSESGKPEIYVVPFKNSGSKILVSNNGGHRPLWSSDGKILYYLENGKLMKVDVNTGPQFSAGVPTEVFSAKDFYIETGHYYSQIPGTKNFIFIREKETNISQNSLNIIPNWNVELKNKLANAN